jgi:hypothetical protein
MPICDRQGLRPSPALPAKGFFEDRCMCIAYGTTDVALYERLESAYDSVHHPWMHTEMDRTEIGDVCFDSNRTTRDFSVTDCLACKFP